MWVQHPVKPRVPRPHPLLSPALCVCSVLHEVVGDSQAPVWVLHPRSTPGSWGEWVQAPHPACTQPVVAGHPGSFWICPTAGSWWGPRWGCRGASVPPGAVACPGEHLGGGVSHLLACMWSTPASGSQQEQAPCVPSSPRLSPGSPHLFHHFRGTPQPARACEAVGLHPPVGAGCWVLPAPGCCCRGNGFVGLHHLLVPPGWLRPDPAYMSFVPRLHGTRPRPWQGGSAASAIGKLPLEHRRRQELAGTYVPGGEAAVRGDAGAVGHCGSGVGGRASTPHRAVPVLRLGTGAARWARCRLVPGAREPAGASRDDARSRTLPAPLWCHRSYPWE